ncbi:MAG TPA: hypothetical protein VKV40_23315 [Ktedonobacteraceae bacterium]|nr:hypothetical protein [Ktedonobacteraceae bacterium]
MPSPHSSGAFACAADNGATGRNLRTKTCRGFIFLYGISEHRKNAIAACAATLNFFGGIIVVGALLFGISNTLFNVNELSLRQQVTPDRLLGRVGAGMQFIGVGTLPPGALLGGLPGEHIGGLRLTFLIGYCDFFLAFLWTLFSPVRKPRMVTSEA